MTFITTTSPIQTLPARSSKCLSVKGSSLNYEIGRNSSGEHFICITESSAGGVTSPTDWFAICDLAQLFSTVKPGKKVSKSNLKPFGTNGNILPAPGNNNLTALRIPFKAASHTFSKPLIYRNPQMVRSAHPTWLHPSRYKTLTFNQLITPDYSNTFGSSGQFLGFLRIFVTIPPCRFLWSKAHSMWVFYHHFMTLLKTLWIGRSYPPHRTIKPRWQ